MAHTREPQKYSFDDIEEMRTPEAREKKEIPTVVVNHRSTAEILQDLRRHIFVDLNHERITYAKTHLTNGDNSPFFCHEGKMVFLDHVPNGQAKFVPVTKEKLKFILVYAVHFVNRHARSVTPAPCPKEVLTLLHEYPPTSIPDVKRVAPHPVMGREAVLAAPGYYPNEKVWLDPVHFPIMPEIPLEPTETDLMLANAAIGQVLDSFCFASPEDRARGVACLLTPFLRLHIDGAIPLQTLSSELRGAGKSLLVDILSVLTTGSPARVKPLALARRQDARALGPLTAYDADHEAMRMFVHANWLDPRAPVCALMGTGLVLPPDGAAHSSLIRFARPPEAPWSLPGRRPRSLLAWVRERREDLLHALLTLAQRWVASGRPMGDFEDGPCWDWNAVVKGVSKAS